MSKDTNELTEAGCGCIVLTGILLILLCVLFGVLKVIKELWLWL